MTEQQDLTTWIIDQHKKAILDGIDMGIVTERARIVKLITRQICFDAQADEDGRCSHHGGKCYELGQLVLELRDGKKPCYKCGSLIDADIYKEELGMCVMCSNAYFDHSEEEVQA
jgi:hypothetical protein